MIVNYQHTRFTAPQAALSAAKPLYTYLTAANGLFLRAEREHLSVQLPLTLFTQPVRGVEPLGSYVRLPKLVPLRLLGQIIQISQQALPNEALFFLTYLHDAWRLIFPDQVQTPGSVTPTGDFSTQEGILIEIHSHNRMDAFFSTTDDAEETGFRVYGVLGRLDTNHPELKMRIGVYGHFIPISYKQIFGVPHER